MDLVDRLTVPGTCALVQASAGLVTCHRAAEFAGLAPTQAATAALSRSAWERHFRKPDQWAFGIGYPETVHALFEELLSEPEVARLVDRFKIAILEREESLFGAAPPSPPPEAGATCGR